MPESDIKQAVRQVIDNCACARDTVSFAPSFDAIVDATWRKLVASALMELIDEGQIDQHNGRYFSLAPREAIDA